MISKRVWIILLASCLGLAVAGCWAAGKDGDGAQSTLAEAAPRARLYTPLKIADIADERIDESSGLAASRRYPGYLWTHNDSGDKARLFLVSPDGETVAIVHLENASAFDWEDMAISGAGENAWVYAGDIGDNFRWRSNLTIYRFREPEIDITKTNQTLSVRAERMTVSYSGRPSDAETLAVAHDHRLLIATKVAGTSQLWLTPRPFEDGEKQLLTRVAEYSFAQESASARLATGGDLSPDGRRFALVTYKHLYEWDVPFDEDGASDWAALWQIPPQISPLPQRSSIEAVCYSANGDRLYLSREGTPMELFEMRPIDKP